MGLQTLERQEKLSSRFINRADRIMQAQSAPTRSIQQSVMQSLQDELSTLVAQEAVETSDPVQNLNLIWDVSQKRAANDSTHDKDGINIEALLALDPDLALAHDDKDKDAKHSDLLMIKQQKRDQARQTSKLPSMARETVSSRSAFDISSSPTTQSTSPRMSRQERISTIRAMLSLMSKQNAPEAPAFKMRMVS